MTPWHATARTLHKNGWKISEIAEFLEKHPRTVGWAIDSNGERLKHRERVQRQRANKLRKTAA